MVPHEPEGLKQKPPCTEIRVENKDNNINNNISVSVISAGRNA